MKRFCLTLLLIFVAQAALAQTIPTFLIGQQPLTVVWDANPPADAVVHYEARVNQGSWVNTALQTQWTMPTLPVGTHVAGVRACNLEQVTQVVQCGPEASVSFAIANPTPVPGAPGAPRIVPPTQVLSGQEIRLLADSFSYVHRLQSLTGGELNVLQSGYPGPFPVTYASELFYLNSVLLALMAMR